MLGWIIGWTVVVTVSIMALDLLGNDEIFDYDIGEQTGTGGLSPYERIEALSCDTKVQFTDTDRNRAEAAVREIRKHLGNNPVECLSDMDAKSRLEAAKELHKRLCTRFSLNLGLEMGEGDGGIVGGYCAGRKVICVDYRYLLSDKPKYIAEYLDTVIHEFRHAMQHRFIEDGAYNGVDEDYRERIAVSFSPSVYVEFYENPELYYNQLCERDAREYAGMVMQLLKGEKQNV